MKKNPYCPNCNDKLNLTSNLRSNEDLNRTFQVESFYKCDHCSINNQVMFYRIYNNGYFTYNFQFMFENMNLIILDQDGLLEIGMISGSFYEIINFFGISVYIGSIEYPYLNKEAVKYLENLIFR